VNLSAKIEQENKVQGVRALCDAATYELALAQGYEPPTAQERLPGVAVAGIGQPVDLVVLVV
jgi:adenylate cyclase